MDKAFDNLTLTQRRNHRGTAGEKEAQTRGRRVTWPAGCAGSGFSGLIYSVLPPRNSRSVTILRAWSSAIAIVR